MNILFELDKLLYNLFQENTCISTKDFNERLGVSGDVSHDIIYILKTIGVVEIIDKDLIKMNENYRCLIDSLNK